jgi:preprotein translocase subunit SecE
MAKKTSKQGKKSNKKSGQEPTAAAQYMPPRTETPSKKKEPSAKEQQKPSAKAESSTKEQAKSSKDQKGSRGGKQAPKKEGIFKRIATYFKNVRLEIKRTTWPSRAEVLRMSIIVVGALIFFGVFIFVIDWLMTRLVEFYSAFSVAPDPAAVDPAALDPAGTDSPATDPAATDSPADNSATEDPATEEPATEDPATEGSSDESDTEATEQ